MRDNPVPMLKDQLSREVRQLMHGWDTPELMSMLHTSESRVSKLRNGRTSDISLERLIEMVSQLGAEVTITIAERRRERPSGGAGRKA